MAPVLIPLIQQCEEPAGCSCNLLHVVWELQGLLAADLSHFAAPSFLTQLYPLPLGFNPSLLSALSLF